MNGRDENEQFNLGLATLPEHFPDNGETFLAVMISAVGFGLDDESLDATGKRFALAGTGAQGFWQKTPFHPQGPFLAKPLPCQMIGITQGMSAQKIFEMIIQQTQVR